MHETANFLLKLKGNSMHTEYGKIINFASIGFSLGLWEESLLSLVYIWFCGAGARINSHQGRDNMLIDWGFFNSNIKKKSKGNKYINLKREGLCGIVTNFLYAKMKKNSLGIFDGCWTHGGIGKIEINKKILINLWVI